MLRTFLDNLRSRPLGRLYWANISMQISVGILDLNHCKKILQKAIKDKVYQQTITSPSEDKCTVAVMALHSVTKDNVLAMSGITPHTKIKDLPDVCSTVTTQRAFHDHYLSDEGRESLSKLAIKINPLLGRNSLPIVTEDNITTIMQSGYDTLEKLKEAYPEEPDFLRPKLTLESSVSRFWLSGHPDSNLGDAATINNRLALGYTDGEPLVRISFNRTDLEAALTVVGNANRRLCRPSALCVNDITFPRFRGRRSSETTNTATHLDKGQTVSLSQTTPPTDGLDEWMCPTISLDSSKVKIEFLGVISGASAHPDMIGFADYLDTHRGFSSADDESLIARLVA